MFVERQGLNIKISHVNLQLIIIVQQKAVNKTIAKQGKKIKGGFLISVEV